MTTPNATNWRAWPAGRELDALVWERVFGRPAWVTSVGYTRGFIPQMYEDDGRQLLSLQPKPYSTDIAAAWSVLHRLLTTRAFGVFVSGTQESAWNCFIDDADGRRFEAVDCGSPALAICRAALAAVEGV